MRDGRSGAVLPRPRAMWRCQSERPSGRAACVRAEAEAQGWTVDAGTARPELHPGRSADSGREFPSATPQRCYPSKFGASNNMAATPFLLDP